MVCCDRAISISLTIKNKSTENILNNKGPGIEPHGTPETISGHSLYDEFVLILCFLLDR